LIYGYIEWVEHESSDQLWHELFDDETPRVTQASKRPVPGFSDVGLVGEPPLVAGIESKADKKNPRLAVSVSDTELLLEWLKEPSLKHAKALRAQRQPSALQTKTHDAADVGTLIHAIDGFYEAHCQPTFGLSDHQLIRRMYPTIQPDEEAMYANILGQVKKKGSLPVAQAVREIDIAYANALEDKLQEHRQNSGGYAQSSWLDAAVGKTTEERLLEARSTPEYQTLLDALTSAWQKPSRVQRDLHESLRTVGVMREVTIVDNQGEKDTPIKSEPYGRLQVRGRLDRVWFGCDPKTGKIGVEVNDLKTGKGGDSETLTFQMNLMGLVANRFAQGLVKSHQAAHGHGREPAGFVRGEGAFRVMRDINWNKWDERLLGVVVRRIDLQDGVFVEESVDLSLQAREKFHQQYSALCQEVGKQRGIIGFLLGRKSPKK
jgi:hypothetical protein